jgi:hypothetical protein
LDQKGRFAKVSVYILFLKTPIKSKNYKNQAVKYEFEYSTSNKGA